MNNSDEITYEELDSRNIIKELENILNAVKTSATELYINNIPISKIELLAITLVKLLETEGPKERCEAIEKVFLKYGLLDYLYSLAKLYVNLNKKLGED
jgi:hypothetical protein